MRIHEWSGTRLVEAWCRDHRALTFSEYVEEVNRFLALPGPIREELDQQTQQPPDLHEQQLAVLYRECRRRTGLQYSFAVCFLRVEALEEHRRRYGHAKAQRVDSFLTAALEQALTSDADLDPFVAHVGTGDFVLLVTLERTGSERPVLSHVLTQICKDFDHYTTRDPDPQEDGSRSDAARVPMKLSIGVITNQHRTFEHFNQIAELGQEMLDYARSVPGSVFVVDNRTPG